MSQFNDRRTPAIQRCQHFGILRQVPVDGPMLPDWQPGEISQSHLVERLEHRMLEIDIRKHGIAFDIQQSLYH